MSSLRELRTDTRGASTAEYLVIAGLVAIVCIAGFRVFGHSVKSTVDKESERVASLEGWKGKATGLEGEASATREREMDKSVANGDGPRGSLDSSPSSFAAPPEGTSCVGGQCSNGLCFVAGTRVATPDGGRSIESLHEGELVLARDEATGKVAPRPIKRTFVTPGRHVLSIEVLLADGTSELVGATPEHPFWVESKGWVEAQKLEAGDRLSSREHRAAKVGGIAEMAEATTVYNFEVDELHTYFVGQAEAWVHNDCKSAEDIAKLEGQAKAGNKDAVWALGRVLTEGRDGIYWETKGLSDDARAALKLRAATALAGLTGKNDDLTYSAMVWAYGEASERGDKALMKVVEAAFAEAKTRKDGLAWLALDLGQHPAVTGYKGKAAIKDLYNQWGPWKGKGEVAEARADVPAPAPVPMRDTAPRGETSPPKMSLEQAAAVLARPGNFRLIDQATKRDDGRYRRDGVLTEANLRKALSSGDLPPPLRAAIQVALEPDNFKKLDVAAQTYFGTSYTVQVRQGRGSRSETKTTYEGKPDGVIAPVDLLAQMTRSLTTERALAIAHTHFDKLDTAALGGEPDGKVALIDLQKAADREDFPLELRAAARFLQGQFRTLDTAADDIRPGVTHTVRVSVGRGSTSKTVAGAAPDGLFGKRDLETLLVQKLGPQTDLATAVDQVRHPAVWGQIAPGGKATLADFEKAWRREDLTPDARIAAKFLADKKNFDALANASQAGKPGEVSREDLASQRPIVKALVSKVGELPRVEPSAEEKAALDKRVTDVAGRVSAFSDAALPKVEALRAELEGKIKAAWEKDGIPDAKAAELRAEFQAKLKQVLAETGDAALAKDLAGVLEDAVRLQGGDALKENRALVSAMGRMLEMDDARTDFLGLGAAIASKSEIRTERDQALHAEKQTVREELLIEHERIRDAFNAAYDAWHKAQDGIFSMIGTGLADIKRTVCGETTYMDIVNEYFRNTGVHSDSDKLFKIALELYGSRTPTETGLVFDRFWAQYGTVAGNFKHFNGEVADYIGSIHRWRDGYTSVLAAIPAITGVGLVVSVAAGAAIKGSTSVIDDATGGRDIDWNKAGYNVAVGGLENLSGGVGGLLGKGAGGFAGRTLTKSLGPMAGRLGEAGATIVVRGGSTGGMIGAIRPTLDGKPEHLWESIKEGAKWGILIDGSLHIGGAGVKRMVNGPTPRVPTPALEPRVSAEGRIPSSNDTIIFDPAATQAGGPLAPGAKIKVVRSSGAVEGDWQIVNAEGGRVVVSKNVGGQPLIKNLTAAEVFAQNPNLLKGLEVKVPRSSGPVEGGWKVEEVLPNGNLKVSKQGVGYKEIPPAKLFQTNPELIGGAPGVPSAPVAKPAPKDVVATGEGRAQSESFLANHRVEPNAPVKDGYADGGRGMKVGGDGKVTSGREVLVVDRTRDAALQKHLEYARSLKGLPELERATKLAQYVDDVMNPAAGRGASQPAVDAWQAAYKGKEVLLGDVEALGGGVCRHRSLLFKVLGDEAGLNVALVRGNLQVPGNAGPRLGGHAWNELVLANGERRIVDIMNPKSGFRFPTMNEGAAYYGMNGKPLYAPPPKPATPGPSGPPTQTMILPPKDVSGATGGTMPKTLAKSLTPSEAKEVAAYASDLGKIADGLEKNPLAVGPELAKLDWPKVKVSWDKPIQMGESQFSRLGKEADELAKQAGVTRAEALEYLLDEKFETMLKTTQSYYHDPRTGVTHAPKDIEVYGGGKTRPLNLDDPIERGFAVRHARCQIEEFAHGAGSAVRAGEYTPLTGRMYEFQGWLEKPSTQSWLKENFTPEQIAEMPSKYHEADITDLLHGRSPHNASELARYEVRQAYMRFLEERAARTPKPPAPEGPRMNP